MVDLEPTYGEKLSLAIELMRVSYHGDNKLTPAERGKAGADFLSKIFEAGNIEVRDLFGGLLAAALSVCHEIEDLGGDVGAILTQISLNALTDPEDKLL